MRVPSLSVIFCLLTIVSSTKDTGGVGNGADRAVLGLVDAAFRKESNLNEQILESLRSSQTFLGQERNPTVGQDVPPYDQNEDPEAMNMPEAGAQPVEDSPSETSHEPLSLQQASRQIAMVSNEVIDGQNHLRGPHSLHLASIQHHSSVFDYDTSVRPGAVAGTVDVVTFGIFAKQLLFVDLKKNKFTVDSIMALKWKDPRAAALVPAGLNEVSLSGKQAMSKIWMPEIVITNRDIRAYELISTTVLISKDGSVTKVERAGVRCNNVWNLPDFPFDQQFLRVKIASSKYMLSDVVLAPDEDASSSGASADVVKGTPYGYGGHKVYAFEEVDGAMKKSRGVLQLIIKRGMGEYTEKHLMPAFMLLLISWGVFWFPFEGPFITPRLALSILALLSFTTLLINSSKSLPAGAPYNWNDCFNQQIQTLMFCTILLNIFAHVCKMEMKLEAVAVGINKEGKFVLPLLSIVVCVTVLCSGKYKLMSLEVCTIVVKTLMGIVLTAYVGHNWARVSRAAAEKAAQPPPAPPPDAAPPPAK